MSQTVGFVGLGTMGGPMAGHLQSAGQRLVVWNRTAAKCQALHEAGATIAESLAELAPQCDVIAMCVNRTEDVRECLAQIIPHAKPGTLIIDHSTISPAETPAIGAELAAVGLRFVDAPVTGGSMGAQKGTLTVFLGGEPADTAEAEAIIAPYSKRVARVGSVGSGQMMKMANQIAVGGALMALCECLAFAHKAGLDIAQAREMINTGAGGSWAFENYGPMILKQDWTPGFSIKNQRKDFAYCFEAAEVLGAQLPGTTVVDHLLGTLAAQGHNELTTAKLYELLAGTESSEASLAE